VRPAAEAEITTLVSGSAALSSVKVRVTAAVEEPAGMVTEAGKLTLLGAEELSSMLRLMALGPERLILAATVPWLSG
jgi:hypothetical protein